MQPFTLWVAASIFVTATIACCQQPKSRTNADEDVRQPSATERELLNTQLAYGATLYNLARERFAAHERKSEIWIMCINDTVGAKGLKKYSDGAYVVVSIPTLSHEREGLCLYVSHYNSLNTRKADLLALNGRKP